MPVDSRRLTIGLERFATQTMYVARDLTVGNARDDPRVPRGNHANDRTPPVGPRLRESIKGEPTIRVSGTRRTMRLVADVPQAATTDKGARPHIIRPKRANGLLVFYWPKVGQVVAFPYVNHPGNAAHPWWEAVLTDAFKRALRDAARQVAG